MPQEKVREMFIKYLNKHHAKVSQIAKEIGVVNSLLAEFRNDKRDISPRVLKELKNYITQKENTSILND